VSPKSLYFQNAISESLNLALDVIWVSELGFMCHLGPTGLNQLRMLTWRGPTCGSHMSVGYISIYFYFEVL
jgi:hypothetical protein